MYRAAKDGTDQKYAIKVVVKKEVRPCGRGGCPSGGGGRDGKKSQGRGGGLTYLHPLKRCGWTNSPPSPFLPLLFICPVEWVHPPALGVVVKKVRPGGARGCVRLGNKK